MQISPAAPRCSLNFQQNSLKSVTQTVHISSQGNSHQKPDICSPRQAFKFSSLKSAKSAKSAKCFKCVTVHISSKGNSHQKPEICTPQMWFIFPVKAILTKKTLKSGHKNTQICFWTCQTGSCVTSLPGDNRGWPWPFFADLFYFFCRRERGTS